MCIRDSTQPTSRLTSTTQTRPTRDASTPSRAQPLNTRDNLARPTQPASTQPTSRLTSITQARPTRDASTQNARVSTPSRAQPLNTRDNLARPNQPASRLTTNTTIQPRATLSQSSIANPRVSLQNQKDPRYSTTLNSSTNRANASTFIK